MNKKRTKIIGSVASIAMSMSLIVGGTYALFTSDSAVNVAVTSGKVRVVATIDQGSLVTYSMGAKTDKNGVFANHGTADFDEETSDLVLDRVAPGDKVEFKINVDNQSNIDILYRVSMSVRATENSDTEESTESKANELSEALVSTVDGVTFTNGQASAWELDSYIDSKDDVDVIPVSVELPVSANNDCQDSTANVTFTVEAIQGNAFVGGATVEENTALEDVLTEGLLANENVLIKLGQANLTWETGALEGSTPFGNENTKSVTIVGESSAVSKFTATGAGTGPIRVKGGTLTFNNVEIVDETKSYVENSWEKTYLEFGDDDVENQVDTFVFENCVFDSGIRIIGNATFTNCKFKSNVKVDSEYAVWVSGGNATFENCEFTGHRGLKMHEAYGSEIESVTVNLCTFKDLTQKPGVAIGTLNAATAVTIQNSEFINCQKGDQGLYVYETDTNVKNFNFVARNNTVIDTTGAPTVAGGEDVQVNSAALDTEIKKVEQGESAVIQLGEGAYIMPDSAQGKTLTIIGAEDGETVVATQDDGSYEGCDYSLEGATVTFKNITINTDSSTYTGYARLNATYINCTFNGTYTLYGDSVFNNCTFNVTGNVYNVWTWGAPTAEFNNCTFNSDGKALLLYGQANTKLTVNGCVFNDNGGLTDLKAAIEIGNDYNKSYTLTVNNTTVNGYEINDKGINTGSTLWANKNSMSKDKLNVVVDGVDVY